MFFSSLLRPRLRRVQERFRQQHGDQDPVAAAPAPSSAGPGGRPDRLRASQTREPRHATADFTEADDDDDDESNDGGYGRYGDDFAIEDEDGPAHSGPVLPLFSATYLDSLPIYNITHAIRIIIQARTETTLTWEQLRSPQVSQFLVKPMQQQIRTQHFSRATLYSLMANCLQFAKEGQLYPGNAGTSSTRAKVCELLAIKILKEYTTRELIDALSYDFYPLQGLPGHSPVHDPSGRRQAPAAARTSTLEVAIRASAKHFLAHPLVVQHLEAVWNGAITFYSDSVSREAPPLATPSATVASAPEIDRPGSFHKADARTPLLGARSMSDVRIPEVPGRRTVMLYDPRHQASLFKLSRLRVPRYRSFLSTLSLAVLIGLFLAVLVRRSNKITTLELVFWFWSAGFMLDELVGFNEQGFSLYIMSFWNLFDLGILVLLIVYYFMRAYGIFLIDARHWNDMAYDVLAANAILLLPRIFSVLDHYRYFSQLLIAFRFMAVDLAAVFVLVLISCSGFFVFFTLSKNQGDASAVAYQIFQILMGFTPAAWEVWPAYGWLGKSLMVLFLIICHFLVVTILITVLTNSFLAIASNANEEHQFLFAINTMSMVKDDALFSYVAPGNIFAWLLMPLRYCIPLRQFVQLNRFMIKVTHLPLLLCIYVYEKYWLAPSMYEPTDLVDNPGRSRGRAISFADPASRTAVFSPNLRTREESFMGFQKDRALEEVFRRVPDVSVLRNQRRTERRKTQRAIRSWMDSHDDTGLPLNWSGMESRPVPNEWQRRHSMHRDRPGRLRHLSDIRSAASDPADLMSISGFPLGGIPHPRPRTIPDPVEYKDHTDADGDDELVTNDEDDEEERATNTTRSKQGNLDTPQEDYFTTPKTPRFLTTSSSMSSGGPATGPISSGPSSKGLHSRTLSTNTILFNPLGPLRRGSTASISHETSLPRARPLSGRFSGMETPTTPGQQSPRRSLYMTASRPRPILAAGTTGHSTPTRSSLREWDKPRAPPARRLSSVDTSLMSSDNTNPLGGDDPAAGMSSSFQTQMAMAMMKDAHGSLGHSLDSADRDRMGRLMLARMKTLEESFAEVVREMRELRTSATAPTSRRNSSGDELGHLAMTTIEVAGRAKRGKEGVSFRRAAGRRPISRRSILGDKAFGAGAERSQGKGKEVAHSSDDEDGEGDDGFGKTGMSL